MNSTIFTCFDVFQNKKVNMLYNTFPICLICLRTTDLIGNQFHSYKFDIFSHYIKFNYKDFDLIIEIKNNTWLKTILPKEMDILLTIFTINLYA